MTVSRIQRREWIVYLYDQLAAVETEEEAEKMIALIDHEESFLPNPPPKGKTLLEELTMEPLPPWGAE